MKRTPEPEDWEVLGWAGVLGHRYVGTCDDCREPGKRRTFLECDDLAGWPSPLADYMMNPRAFEQVRFKTRSGRRWRRVR